MLDKVLFYGKGAGKLPTASAVVADIMDIVEKMDNAQAPVISWENASGEDIACNSEYVCSRCIILSGKIDGGVYFENIDKTAIVVSDSSLQKCQEIADSYGSEYKIYSIVE